MVLGEILLLELSDQKTGQILVGDLVYNQLNGKTRWLTPLAISKYPSIWINLTTGNIRLDEQF